jgi:nucleoid DNA-binding protein
MDVDLLSKMVKELILDNEEVSLPGLGTFVSELVPSTFSDKGYTINPPYRRLAFRQRNVADLMLAEFYSRSNGTDLDMAGKIVAEFTDELKNTLQSKKVVALPGLGRLRATRENAFFFIPDADLDIYPEGFGLEPVSLKTHEETAEEVSAAVVGLKAILQEPVAPAVPADPPPEKAPKKRRKAALITFAILVGLVVLFFGLFLLLAQIAPDFIDSILYSPEELRILYD